MTGAGHAPDRWHRIEELFNESIDLPKDQRDALLRQTCGEDDELRFEVESLLANDFQETHLESIVDSATENLLKDDGASWENG